MGGDAPAIGLEAMSGLGDDDWDTALARSGAPFRFSHRAVAGRILERAYPSYRFVASQVTFSDGTEVLLPMVRVSRRLKSLSMVLAMPLGWEGTPIPLEGEIGADHVRALYARLDGAGLLAIHGGAGRSPPAVGHERLQVTHTLDLDPGFEAIWAESFSDKNRNTCRKADRAGVEVGIETGASAADSYYSMYEAASRTWGYDEPPYPRGLLTGLTDSDLAEFWFGRLDGRPIAGAVVLRGSEDLFYWSGAVVREHRDVGPGNAVIRTILESACNRGIRYFDFGASAGITGVEKFKESFGARPIEYRSVELTSTAYRRAERWRRRLSRAVPR